MASEHANYVVGIPGGSWGGVRHAVHLRQGNARWTTARCGTRVQLAVQDGNPMPWPESKQIDTCGNCWRLIEKDADAAAA